MSDAPHTPSDGEETARPPEPGSARLVATLALAGLCSGVAIAGIYEVTLPTITANKARELQEAVFKVVPGASTMQPLVEADGTLATSPEGQEGPTIYATYGDDGHFIGYAIPSEGPGFQDVIALIFGYDPARKVVVGMQVLDSRETPGLGDKIFKDMEFVGSFDELAVDPQIDVVKKGAKSAPNEVDAITGATISSKAVVRIIQEGLDRWRARFPEPGNELPMPVGDPAEGGGTAPVPGGTP